MVQSTGASQNGSANGSPRPFVIGTNNRSSVETTPATDRQSVDKARQRAQARDNQIRKSAGMAISKQNKPNKRDGGQGKKNDFGANAVANYDLCEAETILESNTIVEATRHMAAKTLDFVLVVDGNGRLSGIVTDKDLAFRVVAEGLDPRQTTVAQVMTKDPQCVQSSMCMIEALTKMVSNHFRHLPVMEEERVVGVLDIAKCLYDALQKLELADAAANQIASALETVGKEFSSVKRAKNEAFGYAQDIRDRLSCPKLSSIVEDENVQFTIVNVKASVIQAVKMMQGRKDTAALVTDETGAMVGIFTTKDVLLRVIAAGLDPATTTIIRVMTPHPDAVSVDQSIVAALRQMHIGHYLHLPVLSMDKSISGVVDVLQLTYSMLEQLSALNGCNQVPLWHQLWSPPPTIEDPFEAASSTHGSERLSEHRHMNPLPIPAPNALDEFTHLPCAVVFKIKSGADVFLFNCDNTLQLPTLRDLETEMATRFGPTKGSLYFVDEDEDMIPIRDDTELHQFVQMQTMAGKDKINLVLTDRKSITEPTQSVDPVVSQLPILSIGAGLAIAVAGIATVGFWLLKSQK